MSRTHTTDGRSLRAMAHAKRAYTCHTCGKIVHGNGGKSAHKAAHERRGEKALMRHFVPGDGSRFPDE